MGLKLVMGSGGADSKLRLGQKLSVDVKEDPNIPEGAVVAVSPRVLEEHDAATRRLLKAAPSLPINKARQLAWLVLIEAGHVSAIVNLGTGDES